MYTLLFFSLNSAPQRRKVFLETARMSKKTIHIYNTPSDSCAVCVPHVRARWRDHRTVVYVALAPGTVSPPALFLFSFCQNMNAGRLADSPISQIFILENKMRPPIAFQLIVFLALFAKKFRKNMLLPSSTHELGFFQLFCSSSNNSMPLSALLFICKWCRMWYEILCWPTTQ